MFKFLVKKGLYNLVISTYVANLYVYRDEVTQIINNLTEETTEDEMQKLNFIATQKYYSSVFDAVCQDIGNNIPKFKSLLLLNFGAYNFNPDNLAAAHIYDFAFWCLTGKKANSKKCIEINHYVNDLKNKCLLELNNQG